MSVLEVKNLCKKYPAILKNNAQLLQIELYENTGGYL